MKHFLRLAAVVLSFCAFSFGAEATSKFAFCSTVLCTWDVTNSPNIWFTATGGGGSATTVPTSVDAVTFDGASCSGGTTCTFTVGTTINATSNTVQQITMGFCTGSTTGCIINFATNNPNITTANNPFSITGTGTRDIRMGSGTFTLAGSNPWDATIISGLTFSGASATYVIGPAVSVGNPGVFVGGGLPYGTLSVLARSNAQEIQVTGANSFTNILVSGPVRLSLPISVTTTVSNSIVLTGSPSGLILLNSNSTNASLAATLAAPATATASWAAIKNITVTGNALVASNSFDLLGNTNASISPPSGGGGRCIGC